MSRYEHPDVAFEVPREWEDRSVAAFSAPSKPGQAMAANLVMTRDNLASNDTLRTYADRQLVELAKRLDGFDLHERREFVLAGLAAIELQFAWVGQSGPIEQRMLFAANRKRVVLSFTATASKAELSRLDTTFDRIFNSIRFPDADPAHG